MIKTFSSLMLFVLTAGLLAAQPLKVNQPFRASPAEVELNNPNSLSMQDFRYQASQQSSSSGPITAMQTKPGFALLGSAIVPGLGQAANNKWLRAGAYFLADVIFLAVHLKNQHRAEELQQQYEQFADDNWSVVTYSQWLVEYHQQNNISNPFIDQLQNQVQGEEPAYDPDHDWKIVPLKVLREAERHTPFINSDGSAGNAFSHVMPDYGSQQYYELISKYFQYGPGWNDFGSDRNGDPLDSRYQLAWNGDDMPPHFLEGARKADRFNDKYRIAGNMLSYMILNHVVSAFDAFITVKIKNNRLEAEPNIFSPRQFTLKYRF